MSTLKLPQVNHGIMARKTLINDRGLEDPPVSTQTGESDPNASSQNYYENVGFDDCNVPDSDLNVGAGDSRVMDDDDNDYVDEEEDNVSADEESNASKLATRRKSKLYTLEQINDFLDVTKNVRNVRVEDFFPDLQLFLTSCAVAVKKASLSELEQAKRYRLSKFTTTVRNTIKNRSVRLHRF